MSKIDIEYHKLCTKILKEGYTYTDKSRDITCLQISSYNLELDKVHSNFPLLTTKKMFTKGIVGELLWFLRGDNNIKYLVENGINIWNKDAYNWYLKHSDKNSDGHNNTIEDYIDFIKDSDLLYDEEITLNKKGDVGRSYGVQWRSWNANYGESMGKYDGEESFEFRERDFDQIGNLIQNLINKPMSRRHIITAWNPAELDETALPPCHWAFEIIPYPIPENVKTFLPGYKYLFDLKWHQRSVDTFLG